MKNKLKRISVFAVAVLLVISSTVTAFADDGQSTNISALNWPQFRSSTLLAGITDAKTPVDPNKVEQKWKLKLGSGWDAAPGTPIVVGDYLYVYGNGKINRIARQTGEILKSADCAGSYQFFSQIAYGDGKIFVPRASEKRGCVIYAYDESTLEQLWVTETIGNVDDDLQPLSPILYYNGYIYMGASDGSANAGIFTCFDVKDIDTQTGSETKSATWAYVPKNEESSGYYWSGGAVVGNAIVFGGESGEIVSHSLTSDKVYDTIKVDGAIRSTAHYDAANSTIYVSTKTGYVHSVKISSDLTFNHSTLKSKYLMDDLTSSPVVYNGRLYLASGGIGSANGFFVLDAATLDTIYEDRSSFHSQSSPIVSTAYATPENNYRVYVYVVNYLGYDSGDYSQYSPDSSCVYVIKDHAGQTALSYEKLIVPDVKQYCSQSVTVGSDGTLYYYNDSCNIFAFGNKDAADGQYSAADVDNAVSRLPVLNKLTSQDSETVKLVNIRYSQLPENEKSKVKKYASLQSAVQKIDRLTNEAVQIPLLIADISKLDLKNITLNDESSIRSLSDRYAALSDTGKAQVTNDSILQQAVNKIAAFLDDAAAAQLVEKIADLKPVSQLVYDNESMVNSLYNLYESQNQAVKDKITNYEKLLSSKSRIEEIGKEIQSINAAIWEIKPLNITMKDKDTVADMIARYQALSEQDKKHINSYDDVLYAEKVIKNLESGIVIPDVFQNIMGTDSQYTISGKTEDGKNYSITFDGRDVTNPLAFDSRISFISANEAKIKDLAENPFIISFLHHGKLPGKANIKVDVSLADGTYSLYYYNAETGKAEFMQQVTVKDGNTSFSIDHCSDYFIAKTVKENFADSTDNTGTNESGTEITVDTQTGTDRPVATGEQPIAFIFVLLTALGAGILLFNLAFNCKRNKKYR